MPGLSLLETISVRPATRHVYLSALAELRSWAALQGVPLASAAQLDVALVSRFDELFAKGHAPEEGSRLIAALKFALPDLRCAGPAALPRGTRALQAWRRRAPSHQRLPLPKICLAAMLAVLVTEQGRLNTAVKWALAFHAYLRPGEADRLLTWQLVPPASEVLNGPFRQWGLLLHPLEEMRPGKTFMWDEAVLIDDPALYPALEWIVASHHRHSSPWDLPPEDDILLFEETAARLGLADLGASRYTLRHGGASHDLMSRLRGVEEAKRRGRWKSDSSLRRYGKETRVLSEMRKVPKETLAYGELALAHWPALLSGRFSLKPPELAPAPAARARARGRPP